MASLGLHHWVFVAACGLSLVVASGGYFSMRCTGFSLQWLLLLQSTGSRHKGFSNCGMQAQQLWCKGLVAPRHVGFSRTRDRTCVPCIGRQILNHCATREVPELPTLQLVLETYQKAGSLYFGDRGQAGENPLSISATFTNRLHSLARLLRTYYVPGSGTRASSHHLTWSSMQAREAEITFSSLGGRNCSSNELTYLFRFKPRIISFQSLTSLPQSHHL